MVSDAPGVSDAHPHLGCRCCCALSPSTSFTHSKPRGCTISWSWSCKQQQPGGAWGNVLTHTQRKSRARPDAPASSTTGAPRPRSPPSWGSAAWSSGQARPAQPPAPPAAPRESAARLGSDGQYRRRGACGLQVDVRSTHEMSAGAPEQQILPKARPAPPCSSPGTLTRVKLRVAIDAG